MHLKARLLSVAVLAGLASIALPAFAGKADSPAALRAKDLLVSNGAAAKRAANDAFVVRDVIVDRDGTEHVRFDRTFRVLAVAYPRLPRNIRHWFKDYCLAELDKEIRKEIQKGPDQRQGARA